MISKLKVATVSDVHVGHHRTKSEFIIPNLKKVFLDSGVLKDIDLFFIAGDFFDRLLTLPVDEVRIISDWIVQFLGQCAKYDVVVRILEGTPSHDWKQSRLFDDKNKHLGSIVDLKYVDTLSIEYIEKFDATVLYVPDEWSEEGDETWKQVTALMRGMGLEKVDFACMHGCFQYQLPIQSAAAHVEDRYLGIVREIIFIGHHHHHTRHDRIFAEGSFDRLSHGEEKPKGYGLYTVDGDTRKVEFIENPYAKIYKTINVLGQSIDEVVKNIREFEEYPVDSHFRLLTRRTDGVSSSLSMIKDLYPQFYWTVHLEDLETNETSLQSSEQEDIPKPITINRDNIRRLMTERLPNLSTEMEKIVQSSIDRCI